MKILLVNKFFFRKGGSETVFFDEASLLASKGHSIAVMAMDHPRNLPSPWPAAFVSRVELDGRSSFVESLKAAGRLLYSWQARRRLRELLLRERPAIAHLHNIHHQISPSILHTLKRHGIPVVMTLHDLKLACPVYTCFSRGRLCERCRFKRFYWCILRKCSKGSILKSSLAALEMSLNHFVLRMERHVDLFLTPSLFLKNKLEDMGVRVPLEHLPNFLDVSGITPRYDALETSYMYFGRLDRVKGLPTLVRAAAHLPWPCTIVGDGELRAELEREARRAEPGRIVIRPHLGRPELAEEIRRSSFVVLPSEWYENFPLAILESFALGKPVIGARIGGIPELIRDGETGLLFEPGNAEDLKEKISRLAGDPALAADMGRRARRYVEERLNPEIHYNKLMDIFDRVRKRRT